MYKNPKISLRSKVYPTFSRCRERGGAFRSNRHVELYTRFHIPLNWFLIFKLGTLWKSPKTYCDRWKTQNVIPSKTHAPHITLFESLEVLFYMLLAVGLWVAAIYLKVKVKNLSFLTNIYFVLLSDLAYVIWSQKPHHFNRNNPSNHRVVAAE